MSATILLIEDDTLMRQSLQQLLRLAGHEVLSAGSGREGIALFESRRCSLVLSDVCLPDTNGIDILKQLREADEDVLVIMLTAFPAVQAAVAAMRAGAYDYIVKPFDSEELKCVIDRALATRQLQSEVLRLRRENTRCTEMRRLVGASPAMARVKELIAKVAPANVPVMILGESGTGKELIADAIHNSSPRRSQAMVKINCSAIPAELLESELFGYEKGAFTGAHRGKAGLLELADGGTLFLDEVAEMAPALQPKLLRVLEGQPFRRVGGTKDIYVDVRIVAATNRDLKTCVTAGSFRQDLFYRLGVFVIDVPPLRERPNDVLLIAESFLERLRTETGKTVLGLTPETQQLLVRYSWPGNVRELRNVLERALILADSDLLLPEHYPQELRAHGNTNSAGVEQFHMREATEALETVERLHIIKILEAVHGNKTEAARRLGIARSTLKEKLKTFGLDYSTP
jgi:DNA-binding NtrC family response regulator